MTETSHHNATLWHQDYLFLQHRAAHSCFQAHHLIYSYNRPEAKGQQQVWGQDGEVWAPRTAFLRWAAGAQGRWKWMAEGDSIQGADQPRRTRQRKGSQLKKQWLLQLPYSKRRVLFPTPFPGVTKVPDHKSDLVVRMVILWLKRSEGNNGGEEEGLREILMERRREAIRKATIIWFLKVTQTTGK